MSLQGPVSGTRFSRVSAGDRVGMPNSPPLGKRWPRRWLYPALGVILALAAGVGFLGLRCMAGGQPTSGWVAEELGGGLVTYGYLMGYTLVISLLAGAILGWREDKLVESAVTDPLTGLYN